MADAPELTIRVEQIERELQREIAKRDEATKYMHRMVEDVQARYHEIALGFGRIEAAFQQHTEDDKRMLAAIASIDERMRVLERLTWAAMGGVAVIGGLVTIFGVYIINMLGRG